MTREEFSLIAKGMKAIYASHNFMPDKEAFDVWYALLSEYEYKQVSTATKTYMTTEKFPPMPADIINKIHSVSEMAESKPETAIWNEVMRALRNSSYNAEYEFENLDPISQQVLHSPSALKEMATNTDFNEAVEKSHFIKQYRLIEERNRQIARMPQNVRNAIQQKKDNNKGIEDKKNE